MAIVARDDDIRSEGLQVGPYGNNVYVMVCRDTGESVLIDAPAEADKIMELLMGTKLKYILLTHSHMDHVGALSELKHKLNAPVASHPLEVDKLSEPPEVLLNDGDTVSFGKIQLKVLHTPGHTPGSLCFLTGQYLMSGDTIFRSGPGKTGSPEALKQIIESITERLFVLPDDTKVFTGHGESTVLKVEKDEFTIFCSRSHDPKLCGDVVWLSS